MRTIITAYDFSIYAPDEYAFIFSPNIMTITLGASYAANAQVTITDNGVTLSRRAINRIVKFDLMPIFESKFPNSDFDITTFLNNNDPFFAGAFNIGINVASVTQTVAFSLRWGALQHDDVINYADYKFPFWPTMPLAINNYLKHTYWEHNSGGSFVGYSPQLLHFFTTNQFVYTISDGANVQNVTYYPVNCPSDGRYLRWVDSYGRVVNFMFYANKNEGILTSVEEGSKIRRYPSDYTDSGKGRDVAQIKAKKRTFTCFASVDTDIFGIVASVVASPIVYMYMPGRWIRVNVQPTQIIPSTSWMSDIEFTIELPEDYTQRL